MAAGGHLFKCKNTVFFSEQSIYSSTASWFALHEINIWLKMAAGGHFFVVNSTSVFTSF